MNKPEMSEDKRKSPIKVEIKKGILIGVLFFVEVMSSFINKKAIRTGPKN